MKVYIKACANCDNQKTAHTKATPTKKGFMLRCEKCKMICKKSHSNTFLKDREILLDEFE